MLLGLGVFGLLNRVTGGGATALARGAALALTFWPKFALAPGITSGWIRVSLRGQKKENMVLGVRVIEGLDGVLDSFGAECQCAIWQSRQA